jgi:hypothetical protein
VVLLSLLLPSIVGFVRTLCEFPDGVTDLVITCTAPFEGPAEVWQKSRALDVPKGPNWFTNLAFMNACVRSVALWRIIAK